VVPDKIHFVPALPRARSGKLIPPHPSEIAEGDPESLGDTSRSRMPSAVDDLRERADVARLDDRCGGAIMTRSTWTASSTRRASLLSERRTGRTPSATFLLHISSRRVWKAWSIPLTRMLEPYRPSSATTATRQVPRKVDLAVVAVPAKAVPDVVARVW